MTTDEKAKPTARLVPCPRCRKLNRFDSKNLFRPFCSAVCKDEDIISWAEERYRIASQAATEDDAVKEDDSNPDD